MFPSRCLLLGMVFLCVAFPSNTVRESVAADAISIMPSEISLRGLDSSHGILVQRQVGDDIGEEDRRNQASGRESGVVQGFGGQGGEGARQEVAQA